jgi:hypothetical protein
VSILRRARSGLLQVRLVRTRELPEPRNSATEAVPHRRDHGVWIPPAYLSVSGDEGHAAKELGALERGIHIHPLARNA